VRVQFLDNCRGGIEVNSANDRRRFVVFACAVIIASVLFAHSAARAADDDPDSASPSPASSKNWALTVRGGVSLGAYEAGLSWASVRQFRAKQPNGAQQPDIRVITGASAGNINAFLTAIAWCQSNAASVAETATNNPFWNSWIPIGFGELFPGPDSPRYRPDDGLLTRSAFDGVESRLRTMLVENGRFDTTRCTAEAPLRLGVTVTRARPATVCLGEDGHDTCNADGKSIPIKSQRFVLPFDVNVEATQSSPRLVFKVPPKPLSRSVGSELRLVTTGDKFVSTDDLIAVMEASSAFPVAFAPRRITYCDNVPGKPADKEGCQATSDKFFDGGVFDNIPLGLAVNLAIHALCEDKPAAARPACEGDAKPPEMSFLYMDPGNLRAHEASTVSQEVEDRSDRRGLGNTIDFLTSFIDVSTQYELQSVDRYVYKPHGLMPLPLLTSHFHAIIGEYLLHFGAFLAKPFREYDYYVGIYDSVWNRAVDRCGKEDASKNDHVEMASCLVREFVEIHDDELTLQQNENRVASFVARRLFTNELESFVGDPASTRAVLQMRLPAQNATAAEWLTAKPAAHAGSAVGGDEVELMDAIVTTQLDIAAAQRRAEALGPRIAEKINPPVTFFDFVARLSTTLDARSVRVEAFFTEDERDLLEDPGRWLRLKSALAMERLNDIEREDDYGFGKALTVLTQLIANSDPVRAPSFLEVDPSSVPDRFTGLRLAMHFFPYYFGSDVVHGGYEVGWRPTIWPLSWFGFALPTTPIYWERGSSQITGAIGAGIVFGLNSSAVTQFELTPFRFAYEYGDVHRLFDKDRSSWGGEVAAYFAAGKLRLALATVDYGGWKQERNFSLKLGVADINGLIYWAIRLIHG